MFKLSLIYLCFQFYKHIFKHNLSHSPLIIILLFTSVSPIITQRGSIINTIVHIVSLNVASLHPSLCPSIHPSTYTRALLLLLRLIGWPVCPASQENGTHYFSLRPSSPRDFFYSVVFPLFFLPSFVLSRKSIPLWFVSLFLSLIHKHKQPLFSTR